MEQKRENFGSRLGFVLVSAGCAIGIGNVWKFPYVCGQNGGAHAHRGAAAFKTMDMPVRKRAGSAVYPAFAALPISSPL